MADEKKDGRANNDGSKSLAAGDGGLKTIKPEDGLAPGPSDIRELQERFPTAKSVSVKRYTADRRWESLGSVPWDIMDDDYMVNEFGAGLYTLYLRDEFGKLLGGTPTIRIGERINRGKSFAVAGGAVPETPPAVPYRAGLQAGAEAAARAASDQLELMKLELGRRDEMLYRMIDALASRPQPPASAPAPAAAAPTLVDFLTAFEKFQKLQPAAAPVTFSEKLMERAFNMLASRAKDSGSGGGEWFDFLKDVWTEVKGPLMQLAAPAIAPAAPGGPLSPVAVSEPAGAAVLPPEPPAETVTAPPPAAVSAEGDELQAVEVDLDPWITDLKEHCRAGRPAEIVASFIKSACEKSEEVAAITEEIVTGDFEAFIGLDAELAQPAFRDWFKKLFEVVRVQFLASDRNSGGTGRNGTNA